LRAPSGEQWQIVHGEQRAVVVEVGGGIRCYSIGDRDLLDGYGADEMCSAGRGQIQIPWPNRVGGGRYVFNGRHHQLALTEPERSNAIHGLVRWAQWTATDVQTDRVVVEYDLHPQPGYPYFLELSIEYRLAEDGLRVRTAARNAGPAPCPFGSGAHPYLTAGTRVVDDAVLLAPAGTVLLSDQRGIPEAERPVDGTEYDFRRPLLIGSTTLDHCFTDLVRDEDGLARFELVAPGEGTGVVLWVNAAYTHLMLFTGDPLPEIERRSLAVEPMTCPPDAFRSGTGLITLPPGGSWLGEWGIAPIPAGLRLTSGADE
jgi:galactose mutarotase-like enzyme